MIKCKKYLYDLQNDSKCIKIQSLNQGIYWIHNLVLLTLIKGHLILISKVARTGN